MLALVVLALAATVASAVARRSSALALQANSQQQDLQRRWAMTSLQATFGGRIEKVLPAAEARAGGPVHWCRRRVRLNDADVELVFGDEQARANANAMYRRRGRFPLMDSLRRLLDGSSLAWRAELVAMPSTMGNSDSPLLPFESFAQLLPDCGPTSLVEPFSDQPPPVHNISCWGDGKINFRRATQIALAEATEGILSHGERTHLLSLRREIPGLSLAEALKRLELTDRQLAEAAGLLTDHSTCYSLWIVMRTPGRCWYRLAIYRTQPDSDTSALVRTFAW